MRESTDNDRRTDEKPKECEVAELCLRTPIKRVRHPQDNKRKWACPYHEQQVRSLEADSDGSNPKGVSCPECGGSATAFPLDIANELSQEAIDLNIADPYDDKVACLRCWTIHRRWWSG